MRFDVLTLFPEIFSGYLGQSILKLAIERGLVEVNLFNIRDWSHDKHQSVDDRPFGGGPGMVLRPEPVVECVEAVRRLAETAASFSREAAETIAATHLVALTPQGRRLDQRLVEELAGKRRVMLLCGRYEGFDQRILDILRPDEISIGDYILGGGETAAMVVIDAVARLIPGVLGHDDSSKADSFSGDERWLEYPQFTRPREYRGLVVPEVLLSGNHQEIARWRKEQSLDRTRKRRADLLGE